MEKGSSFDFIYLHDQNVMLLNLLTKLFDANPPQLVNQIRGRSGVGGGYEASFKIVKLVFTELRSKGEKKGRRRRDSPVLKFQGDGVPALSAMAIDGTG